MFPYLLFGPRVGGAFRTPWGKLCLVVKGLVLRGKAVRRVGGWGGEVSGIKSGATAEMYLSNLLVMLVKR